MKQKTKQLQSSGETRKTNRTWHFLSTLNSLLLSKLLLLLIIPVMGTANAWAVDYYTPTADEVIILNTVYDGSKSSSGYSKHAAIAWAGTASANSKKAGDPNNSGAATSSNVNCYSIKNNGKGKNITMTIAGCSKVILYHWQDKSSYPKLILTPSEGEGSTLNGEKNVYYNEFILDGSKSYSINLEGTTGSTQTDFWVYAIKLVKGTTTSCATPVITCTGNTVSITCATDGASIYYTLDGSTPTSGSTLYNSSSKPSITSTTTVKAIAIKGGLTNSSVSSQSFTMYDVTYDGNGKESGSAPATAYYVSGSNVTVSGNNDLGKAKYVFAGWNTSNAASATVRTHYNKDDKYSGIDGNVTFYAVWKHQVAIQVNDEAMGTASATYNTADSYYRKEAGNDFVSGSFVSHDVQLTLTATPNPGYHFDTTYKINDVAHPWGNGTDETNNPATVPVGDNKTYTAHFAPNAYTVAFNANGGTTGTMSDQGFTYATAQALRTNTYTRSGYTFDGWATSADGEKVYNDGQSVNNLTVTNNGTVTLYAHWAANEYAITLDKGTGGSADGSATATYGSNELSSVTDATKAGSTLLGYYAAADGNVKVANADGTLVKNVAGYTDASGNWTSTSVTKLYAHWEAVAVGDQKFHFVSKKANASIDANPEIKITATESSYATTLNGGSLYYYNDGDENYSNGLKFGHNADYLKIDLGSKQLAVGDVIICNATKELIFTLTSAHSATAPATTNGKYTITSSDGFAGESIIYVHRKETTGTSVAEITISAASGTVETYTIHYDLWGKANTISDATKQTALPATLPTPENVMEGYTFEGWYTDAARTTEAEAGATISAETTLYANYIITAPTMSPASGALTTGDVMTLTSSVSFTNAYMGWSTNSTPLAIGDEGMIHQYSGDARTTMQVTAPAMSGTLYFTWIISDGTFYSEPTNAGYSIFVPVTKVTLNKASTSLTIGGTETLTATVEPSSPTSETLVWTSGDPTVATVSSTGVVTAVGVGTATIAAVATQGTDDPSDDITSVGCVVRVTSGGGASSGLSSVNFSGSDVWTSGDGSVWSSSDNTDLAAVSGNTPLHGVTFRNSSTGGFSIDGSEENQVLKFNDNASTTRWFAIPVSGIEGGRIDVYIKTKYASNSGFKFKMYFDTAHGTTVQTSSGTLSVPTFDYVDKYEGKDGVFHFRIKDLLVKSGVLYMGPSSSSFREIQAVKITTSETNFTASPSSVTIGDDTTQPVQVTILNNTAFVPIIKTAPNEAVATALYNRSDGVLDITPVAAGSTNVVMALDENMNGQWDEGENTTINIPITVNTISVTGQPASAVYATGANAVNLSVTASVASGTLRYQWYKNTVNSTVGGAAISGATGKTYKPSTSATEEAAFYYCELTADGYQSKYSDVAYILTSSTYRYFHMSNVAGNRQTSDASELITGEVIAGGTATAIRGTGDYYRYITRPATSNPHMYVVKNADNYIKVKLDNKIGTNDLITVRLMGYAGTDRGIKIATDASGSNAITILQDVISEKVYQTVFTDAFNTKDEIYILGIYPGEQNYFTDLYISKAKALKVSAPTPATINTQVGETAPSLSIIASGGAGSYTYQWYWNESNNTTSGTSIDGATSASYTPPTTAPGTKYYYCKVTSAGNTVTSTTAKVVVAAVAHGWYDPSYDAGVNQYVLNSSNYEGQKADPATLTTNFWKNDTKVAFKNYTIITVNTSADNYPKVSGNSNQKYLTFYVKNAVEFSLVGTSSKKTVDVIVNGKTVKKGLVINNTESEKFALRKTDGDTITINNASGDVYLGRLTFYEKVSPTISVEKDGEVVSEATQYLGDGGVSYEIISNSTGTIDDVTSDNTGVATVAYSNGIMTVTPVTEGTTTIKINQAGDSNYSAGSTTFKVTVQKHVLSLAFSYNEASFGGSRLVANEDIASEKLPTLSVLLDGKVLTDSEISAKGITVKYKSDDTSIADFDDETDYTVTYKDGQGAARIYAYVDAMTYISSAKTYFDLSVTNGTNNKLSNGEAISPQQSYMVKNSDGVELIRVIYGGFKYGGEGNNKHQYSYGGNTVTDKWSSAAAHTASLDGFKYYTKNGDNDAMNEYFHNIYSSMTEEYEDNKGYKHDMREIWYQSGEKKPDGTSYRPFERVKPFALPCRADYLKFEPMKSGKLTVYVIQNGVLGISKNSTQLGTRPRVGYWFDQDGWRIDPIVTPVSKHVLGADQGRDNNTYDSKTYEEQMDKWNSNTHGDIIKLLKYEYCSVANPTTETDVSAFSNTEDGTYKYANPYVWPKNSVVNENRNKIIPQPMKPVPYHGGYMMFQEAFVKYTINVVAGKTYYFTGSSTKVGYVGLNFVEDESVLKSGGNNIDHEENTLHLTSDDDMTTYTFNGKVLTKSTLFDEVTLPSNYKDNQWSAICLPFALSEKQVEEAFGYGTELTLYNGLIKKGTDYTVKFLTHVDQNILPGQPYFIRPTGVDKNNNPLPHVDGVIGSNATGAADGKIRLTFNTVLIDINNLKQAYASYGSNANVDVDGKKTGEASYVFTGSYAPVDPLTKYSYIMNAGILRRYTGSKLKFPTYMAYIAPKSDNAKNGSMSFHADFEDNVIERTWIDDDNDAPTSVITIEEIADAMNAAERKNSDKTYNVMGQQIDPRSAKGLVIKNGKKYIFE